MSRLVLVLTAFLVSTDWASASASNDSEVLCPTDVSDLLTTSTYTSCLADLGASTRANTTVWVFTTENTDKICASDACKSALQTLLVSFGRPCQLESNDTNRSNTTVYFDEATGLASACGIDPPPMPTQNFPIFRVIPKIPTAVVIVEENATTSSSAYNVVFTALVASVAAAAVALVVIKRRRAIHEKAYASTGIPAGHYSAFKDLGKPI